MQQRAVPRRDGVRGAGGTAAHQARSWEGSALHACSSPVLRAQDSPSASACSAGRVPPAPLLGGGGCPHPSRALPSPALPCPALPCPAVQRPQVVGEREPVPRLPGLFLPLLPGPRLQGVARSRGRGGPRRGGGGGARGQTAYGPGCEHVHGQGHMLHVHVAVPHVRAKEPVPGPPPLGCLHFGPVLCARMGQNASSLGGGPGTGPGAAAMPCRGMMMDE